MRKFEKKIDDRKLLVARLKELTGLESTYTFVPRCAYVVGSFMVEKDGSLTVEEGVDEQVLDTLIAEGMIGSEIGQEPADCEEKEREVAGEQPAESTGEEVEDMQEVRETMESEPEDSGLAASISFPLSKHTPSSLINLICMIHSRGPLLSKATGGTFSASKALTDDLLGHAPFIQTKDAVEYLQERENLAAELQGITFDGEKITFDGFGTAEDPEHLQTFMKLAAAMNKMAITQKRVQAKSVDDSNEKYALRIWLIRLGLNGDEYKEDRKRLMANLTGHTAFRSEEEKERWTAKQAAKRDALRAAKATAQTVQNAV
jgi:hypothetical protein